MVAASVTLAASAAGKVVVSRVSAANVTAASRSGREAGPVPTDKAAAAPREGPTHAAVSAVAPAAGDAAVAEHRVSSFPSPLDMNDFAGKHGLIVGVANKYSIAWAIAQATAKRGAKLALTYQGRFEDHVKKLAGELPAPPLVLPCDVTSDDEITAVFESVDKEFGGLDFVVHGAAFAPPAELEGPFLDTTRDGFRVALDVSAYSLIPLTRGAVPLMERRGGGSIVALTFLGADRVFPRYNVMGVAKAALESTVRYLAADVGPKNIRVNAVSAGPIKTVAARGISGFSQILQVYPERAPLRRNIDTSDVAESAAFLLSDASRSITGEVLMVDSGYHAVGM
jgi:enoyl-[acyl-carrier protein] reductase I